MAAKENAPEASEHDEEKIELFDPYSVHFTSQNKRNEFLNALEDDRQSFSYSTVQ